eukprot:CAMPEP_0116825980 /NCGR_PEP_ID=MMETSP0418-20121206/2276_1 /TAXON_ID=1158023 /ORGANISM="Astrosyne radiata, Strain 13vi08-1A" /LENGTH=185 /DNA_ID=CAMNT_0004454567 /DNA_START=190 /DNA_END=748 /DNA_ORIENTATION=+
MGGWNLEVNPSAEPVTAEEQRSRTQTIPLPSYHIPKTQSEKQLCEDMAAAEWRDLCMFYRVVHGIRERQASNRQSTVYEDPTVQNIVLARHTSVPMTGTKTTLQSSSEAFLQGDNRNNGIVVGGFLNSVGPVEKEEDSSDMWSITGFDDDYPEEEPHTHVTVVETDVETDDGTEEESDGVFSIDL